MKQSEIRDYSINRRALFTTKAQRSQRIISPQRHRGHREIIHVVKTNTLNRFAS
jgi:hypothetical protein